jgi:hypothetical protein
MCIKWLPVTTFGLLISLLFTELLSSVNLKKILRAGVKPRFQKSLIKAVIMRKFFASLMILMWAGMGNAQFTELKEARVGFDPVLPDVTVDGENYIFKLEEKYAGEFEKDPVAFLEKYCKIEAFIDLVQDGKTLEYQVVVQSTKGKMKAKYCKEGNLQKVSYRLKNVLLPVGLQRDLYSKYKGWNMTRNSHIARGIDGGVQQEYFKIRLEQGNKVQKLKIDVNELKPIEISSL